MWLLTLPLVVVGSQVAHALAYRLVTRDDAERAHELAATGHAYLAYAPPALAVCSVLVVLALAGELGHVLSSHRSRAAGPSAVGFAVLAPAIFVSQEHFEKLLHDGGFPWGAALQLSFVIGLLLQLPFALAAYLLARVLLGAVRSLGRWLVTPPRPRQRGCLGAPPGTFLFVPRVPALALGYGSRGPPAVPAG